MNLVMQDDEGKIIYGHEVLKRISQTGMTPEVNIVRGILPECFITYVSRRFPEVKEVRDLVASNEINYKLGQKQKKSARFRSFRLEEFGLGRRSNERGEVGVYSSTCHLPVFASL